MQIEKELLAIVFASEKCHHYIYGFHTEIQSDHKPLESIMKKLYIKYHHVFNECSLNYKKKLTIKYTKGKDMHVADALSRAFLNVNDETSEETELAVHTLTNNLSLSERRKTEFKMEIKFDYVLQHVQKLIMDGWPVNINNVP